jgi:hypothetical protein
VSCVSAGAGRQRDHCRAQVASCQWAMGDCALLAPFRRWLGMERESRFVGGALIVIGKVDFTDAVLSSLLLAATIQVVDEREDASREREHVTG